MATLIKNIGTLAGILPADALRLEGSAMNEVQSINNAYLIMGEGSIINFGQGQPSQPEESFDEVIDANGGYVLPSFCDSHTHIVYAGCRDGAGKAGKHRQSYPGRSVGAL